MDVGVDVIYDLVFFTRDLLCAHVVRRTSSACVKTVSRGARKSLPSHFALFPVGLTLAFILPRATKQSSGHQQARIVFLHVAYFVEIAQMQRIDSPVRFEILAVLRKLCNAMMFKQFSTYACARFM